MESEISNIIRLTEEILGSPKRAVNPKGWTEYNCPSCADGKYNLCVNYEEGYYHCWKCLESGNLSRLFRLYGTATALREYYKELHSLIEMQKYSLKEKSGITREIKEKPKTLHLPEECKKIKEGDPCADQAVAYLQGRGLDFDFIKKYDIRYTRWCEDWRLGGRIIIPSYNASGELNYWIGRDYKGKSKLKYVNPQVKKTEIVFNERFVNWYEDVTLVEGVFDHMVIPNSIPLLGKKLARTDEVFMAITKKAMANVNVLLDDDATDDAFRLCRLLNGSPLHNRVQIIICPKGYDASLLYEKKGRKGIIELMRSARKPKEYELMGLT